MRFTRHLLLALAALLASLSLAVAAQADGNGRTYRTDAGDAALLVRVGDEQIDLHHLGTNRTLSVPAFPTLGGLSGLTASGEVVSLRPVRGKPHLRVGTTLLPLTPITPAEYAEAAARAQRPAAPETAGSLNH